MTPKGSLLIEQAIPLVESVDHDFFKNLGSNTKKCVELLKKLTPR
jgi:hypothetical protein